MRPTLILMVWIAAGCVQAAAQTVTVDPTQPADGQQRYATIAAAMRSFSIEAPAGVNANRPEANLIRVVGFGPFDEVLPAVFDANAAAGGALDRVRIAVGDHLEIDGTSGHALVLARQVYSRAAITVRGDCELVLRNLILAPSADSPPERHLIQPIDGGARVTLENCVLTALPAEAAQYASASDLPAGIIDGTRAHEADYVRPTTSSGSYGQAVHVNGQTRVELRDTIITQFVRQDAESFTLLVRVDGALHLGPGCVLRNNAAGLRSRDQARVEFIGEPRRRVIIGENNYFGFAWIQLESFVSAAFEHCMFAGRPLSLEPGDSSPQQCIYSAGTGSLSVRESIFTGGYAGSGGSNAIWIATQPAALTLDDLTIHVHRYGLINGTGVSYNVSDSIFTGLFRVFTNGGGTITTRHCVMPSSDFIPLAEPLDFTHPDFVLKLREDAFFASYDRGQSWSGPYALPSFGQTLLMARTDYAVLGPRECMIFLTASNGGYEEGRPFCARTVDGGLSWQFVSWMGPAMPTNQGAPAYSIMPSTVRIGQNEYITALRQRVAGAKWIDIYHSADGGQSWTYRSRPEQGGGNPASMVRLADGRICLTYATREAPDYGIRARLSSSNGVTWGPVIILRDDGLGWDLGYPRTVQRPDGKLVTTYYYYTSARPQQFIAATIWDPNQLQ